MAAAPAASELTAGTHWSHRAVEQLDELGLLPGHLPAQNTLTRAQVHAALLEASQRAALEAATLAPLAAAYLAQFEDEFRAHPVGDAGLLTVQGLSVGLETRIADSRTLAAGPSRLAPWHLPLTAREGAVGASAHLAATLTRHLALSIAPELTDDGARLQRWEVVLGAAGVELSAGRAPVAYGLRGGRGAIMNGRQRFDRLELRTSAPFALPWLLRHLGQWSVDAFVTRVHEARHPGNPFLWGMSVRLRPHPRLTIGAQRGVMFGGGVAPDARGRDVLKMLIASSNQQENNLGSTDFVLRLPTEAAVPLTLYGEWAADDLGAQFKAPGIMAGLRTPALPGLPNVSVGGEFTFFGVLCCRVHTWYSHSNHVGGWSLQEAPLGQPLGGDGREYRAYGTARLLDARLEVEVQGALRERFASNLFAPSRLGRSVALSSSLRWRLLRAAELGLSWEQEWGRGWRTGLFGAQARSYF